nr:MAG TPA: hypothetical protein [Caudoviricetes sp.]
MGSIFIYLFCRLNFGLSRGLLIGGAFYEQQKGSQDIFSLRPCTRTAFLSVS